ncbi:MAG TPA: 4-hydroxythreonine-4-phosphate dehydrogenase PdxA [Verrucomicrobiae bacterium]|nr:4-hydroxythreonine-4-phosphate dehydrogenase PdxA [Verrucomicrobiae bacterium]
MGDPAGIGPEICLRALRDPGVLKICAPVLFGDADILERVAGKVFPIGGMRPIRRMELTEWNLTEQVAEPLIVNCGAIDAKKIRPGKISAACGRAGYVYIECAIQAALAKKIDGVVTAPIHKEALHLAGVKFPGHTEIFTELTRTRRSCMMLYSDKITVSMATTHIGFADVPKRLSVRRVLDVIELTAEAMRRILRRKPKLAICGLNPHAGEHGLFGNREEEKFVKPAMARARRKKISIEGPLPPDAAFTTNQRKKFDAIVCLYHDQGHIPFKMLAFDTGVNVTLGLPMVRTSVDHGTAFDIAWQGRADPRSLFAAIRVAAELSAKGKREGAAR